MDKAWWKEYIKDVQKVFNGQLVTPVLNCYGVPRTVFNYGQNSGLGIISLANHWGAQRIILLGYDCSHTGGKTHWHGDHPVNLGNAGSVNKWPLQFKKFRQQNPNANIINCTRQTKLECFTRAKLEDVLCE